MLLKQSLALLVAICLWAPASAADAPPLSPLDFVALERLGGASLSPDGEYLAYLRSEVNWDINRQVDRVQILRLSDGVLLPGPEPENDKEDFARPVWSPDSRGFAILAEREDDEHEQAYYYELASGSFTRLTSHGSDIEALNWKPDGSGFYFLLSAALDETLAKRIDDDWVLEEYETRQPQELWVFDIATGESDRLIAGSFSVRGYRLSRSGAAIIHMRAPGDLIDDRRAGALWLYDVETRQSQQLTDNTYAENHAALAPDLTRFAYIATVNASGEPYYEDNLFVQRVGDEQPTLLLPELPMEILRFDWNVAGTGLYILGNTGLRSQLYHYDLNREVLSQLTDGDQVIDAWQFDSRSGTHVFQVRTATSPGDVFKMTDADSVPQQLTHEYDALASEFSLPQQAAFTWRGRGGAEIEGLLVYPVSYTPGERFPLVTITHGGPRSSAQFGSWNLSRYVAVLAGQGYGVLLPNHRGGTGYGDRFMRDMVGRYFRNAHHDVMDGIDALIDEGLADPDRLIKMGWSAGGHMTNKLITVTNRFRAASSGAGASDWVSMFGESDVRLGRLPWFGGKAPWERGASHRSYHAQSMLKDTWRVETPTLFFVGGRDIRVPPTQAIMMYRGVKAAGVETALYVAPGQPHNYRLPSYRLFKINTELAWYARHLQRDPFVAVYPDVDTEASDATDEETPCECPQQ